MIKSTGAEPMGLTEAAKGGLAPVVGREAPQIEPVTSSLVRQVRSLFRSGRPDTTSPKTGQDDPVRRALDALPAAIYVTDQAGALVYWNRAAAALAGREPNAATDRWCVTHRLFTADGQHLPHEQCPMAVAIKEDRPVRGVEALAQRPDGSMVPFLPYPTPIHDEQGKLIGAVNMLVDISELKDAQTAAVSRMEEQAALYRFTDRLYRARSAGETYEAALDAICDALRCRRASVLLLDDTDMMRFVAWRNLSDAYRAAVEGHSPWLPQDNDPRPICWNEVDGVAMPEALRATVKGEGIGALAFIPLMANGVLVGKFMAYYDAPHRFTDAEVDLAVTIARQLGFSLERARAETALRQSAERARARAAELQAIMDAMPAPIWIARDAAGEVIHGNRASHELLGLRPEANASLSAQEAERPTNFQVCAEGRVLSPEELPVQRAARGEEIRNCEVELRFADGTSRYLLGNATPLGDAAGAPCGAVATFVDITERKRAEMQRDLLMAELSHRVKNTLATVISIAHQSFSRGRASDEARHSFDGRIRALAQTHTRLAETNWSGASMEAMLLDELAPYRHEDGANFRVAGPRVTLSPRHAVVFGMAFHELATNAAKYGAFSVKEGLVEVSWDIVGPGEQLYISWVESGGPAVSQPDRTGFGRLLLERVLASDLGGTVELDFAETGLRCTIILPLREGVAQAA
jgi:PAS domain S-box-containing protein